MDALDTALRDDVRIDEDRADEIFHRYLGSGAGSEVVRDTVEQVEAELSAVLTSLEAAGGNAAEYGKALETVSGQITRLKAAEDIKAVVTNVLAATRVMGDHARKLETQLTQSGAQMAELREDLDRVRREAMTDGLTGIANRKQFDAALRLAAEEAAETGDCLSLLMLDIDHFKRFNDTYGHPIGDQVLKLLAATLTECVKGQDTAARYGGEEFAVILPRTTLDNATKVAENIRQRIGTKNVVNRKTGENLGKITVSIGAGLLANDEPTSKLVDRTDQALYQAKKSGRNRVVSEAAIVGPPTAASR